MVFVQIEKYQFCDYYHLSYCYQKHLSSFTFFTKLIPYDVLFNITHQNTFLKKLDNKSFFHLNRKSINNGCHTI